MSALRENDFNHELNCLQNNIKQFLEFSSRYPS